VPLECIRQVDRLRRIVMKAAARIRCRTLIVHAREDELTSLRSANFLVEKIGGARARMVVLEDSYHMVCVDNDREIVAKNVLEFFGAALPGATLALSNEPRMSRDDVHDAVAAVRDRLAAGDLLGLRELSIPDLTWAQPGVNAVAGVHAGRAFASFASRAQALGFQHFAAFGTPVTNRGIALVPAALCAQRDGENLQSQGALLLAFHGGKLLEACWFADEIEREDRFFGPPTPETSGPSAEEKTLEAAVATSKTLRKAQDNDTLLALYSLYKQATAGDVVGARPGGLDMVNRAKYDAWAGRRGTSREEAMRQYAALIERLRAAE
jgi:carboxylesterase